MTIFSLTSLAIHLRQMERLNIFHTDSVCMMPEDEFCLKLAPSYGQLNQTARLYQATLPVPKLFVLRCITEFREFPTVIITAFPQLLACEGMERRRSITLISLTTYQSKITISYQSELKERSSQHS